MAPRGVPLIHTADSEPVVWIGFDPHEMRAHTVASWSMRRLTTPAVSIRALALQTLQHQGLYTRPLSTKHGQLWDDLSAAPMSTEHAITRFFLPLIQGYRGWAIFTDGDILVRRSLHDLLELRDERFAVQVVQHPPLPSTAPKKDGHVQTVYPRKNWSSVMLINCGHPAQRDLTRAMLNTLPGRDLHAFCWLTDDLIGHLPAEWNYLVGVNEPPASPAIVHYTLGTPDLAGREDQPFADEWRLVAKIAGIDVARTSEPTAEPAA